MVYSKLQNGIRISVINPINQNEVYIFGEKYIILFMTE